MLYHKIHNNRERVCSFAQKKIFALFQLKKIVMKKNITVSLLLFMFFSLCAVGHKSFAKNRNYEKQIDSKNYIFIDTVVKGGNDYDLVTRIYLPKGKGPWPVVIARSPYFPNEYISGDYIKEGQQYVKRGLGYVLQCCRGKGGSEGNYEPNVYEREDGLALVHWVANQSWCRSIGLFGNSYTALTCWIVADSLPDKVKGIYLHHYGIDRFLSAYKDGLFRQDILTGWAIDNATEIKNKPKRDPYEPYYSEARYMPQKEMDVNMLGVELPWYRDWIVHTNYNDSYWQTGIWATLRNIPSNIKVPMTIVAGLFDHHLEGTLKGYELLPPETQKRTRLILGGWDHSFQLSPGIRNSQHAKMDIGEAQFQWLYDVVAKDSVPEGKVLAYFVGADEWRTFDTWPIEPQGEKIYYLSKKKYHKNTKAYTASVKYNCTSAKLTYIYDPADPVMSVGGETLFNSYKRRGSQIQPEIGYRNDVISFLSDTLDTPMTIAGPIKATIYMSSDCEDTSLTFKISEVEPDGTAYNIRTGITTLAYRNNRFGNRQTYIPNDIVALQIETAPITWQIKQGNRIRIDITSSDFPEYSIHSNYAGVWAEQAKIKKAHQSIYVGENYPSNISIPIIE